MTPPGGPPPGGAAPDGPAPGWPARHGPANPETVGGGSSIDTAKAIDLLLTNPGGLMDYINAPVGQARAGPPAQAADRRAHHHRHRHRHRHRVREHHGLRARRALAPGETLKQQRLLASCPRPVTGDDLGRIFKRSLELW
jgi:hypothetical protein